MGKKYKLIKDQYRKTRGNISTVNLVKCVNCKSKILVYQKDGPPHRWFKRIYLDKILERINLLEVSGERLCCSVCKQIIGSFFIYRNHGENRIAYKVNRKNIIKRLLK